MARKTKSESEQTRSRILDAAEIEMLARGVSRASLECIAQRAQVSRGAIYWHFEDKKALLEAMVQRTAMPLRSLRENLGRELGDADPLNLLRQMLMHGVSRLANDKQHRRVCHIVLHRCEMICNDDAASALINSMFEESHEVMVSMCQEVARTHALRPPLSSNDASDMIIAFMVGLYECSLRHPTIYSVDHGMQAKIDALLASLFQTDQ